MCYLSQYFCEGDDLFDIVRFLIQKRAYVNTKSKTGETPLHVFASYTINRHLKNNDKRAMEQPHFTFPSKKCS